MDLKRGDQCPVITHIRQVDCYFKVQHGGGFGLIKKINQRVESFHLKAGAEVIISNFDHARDH